MGININELINKVGGGLNPVKTGNHKSLVELKKEQQNDASLFAVEQVANMANESVNSNAMQDLLANANGSSDVTELMGLYLSNSGKAANASSTDASAKKTGGSTQDDKSKLLKECVDEALKSLKEIN